MNHDELAELRTAIATAMREDSTAGLLELLRSYHALDPAHPFYRFLFGRQLCVVGRWDQGEPILLSVDPATLPDSIRSPWHICIGGMYEESGRPSEAERYFRAGVEWRPDHTSSWIFLGTYLAKLARFQEALAVFDGALRIGAEGDVDEVHVNIGNVRRALGDYAGAAEAYRRAIAIDPDYAIAVHKLADVEDALELQKAREARRAK
jgi:tetratricopeptide (TPR) repeat protein